MDDNSPVPSYDIMFSRALAKSVRVTPICSMLKILHELRVTTIFYYFVSFVAFGATEKSTTNKKFYKPVSFLLGSRKHHSNITFRALKESGYESDSTLVFRRRDENTSLLSPSEQKEAYKIIQKGGDVPLHGLRKPAPERPKGKFSHCFYFYNKLIEIACISYSINTGAGSKVCLLLVLLLKVFELFFF